MKNISTLHSRSARTAQSNMTEDNTSSDDDSSEDDQYTDLKTLAAQVDLPNDFWQGIFDFFFFLFLSFKK